MDVAHVEALIHQTMAMEGTSQDAEAMDIEEFTMEGSVKVKIDEVLVK